MHRYKHSCRTCYSCVFSAITRVGAIVGYAMIKIPKDRYVKAGDPLVRIVEFLQKDYQTLVVRMTALGKRGNKKRGEYAMKRIILSVVLACIAFSPSAKAQVKVTATTHAIVLTVGPYTQGT